MTEPRRSLTFVGAAAWTISVAVLLDLAIAVTEEARPGALTDLVNVTACHVLAYSIAIFAMLRVYDPETPVRDVVALRARPSESRLASIGAVALAALIGACVYPALSVLETLVARRHPPSAEELEVLGKLMATSSLGRRVFLGASLIVLTPIAEEVFFRGVLFSGLRRAHRAGAVILATALCFAAVRAELRSFPSVLVLGAILGWLRDRSGSILTTIAAQAAFFAVPIVPVLRGADPMADDVFSRGCVAGALGVAVVASIIVELRWRRGQRGTGDEQAHAA